MKRILAAFRAGCSHELPVQEDSTDPTQLLCFVRLSICSCLKKSQKQSSRAALFLD